MNNIIAVKIECIQIYRFVQYTPTPVVTLENFSFRPGSKAPPFRRNQRVVELQIAGGI